MEFNVHKAVIDAGEKTSGATVHYVDKEYDTGEIIDQCIVNISPNETAESLQENQKRRKRIINKCT